MIENKLVDETSGLMKLSRGTFFDQFLLLKTQSTYKLKIKLYKTVV